MAVNALLDLIQQHDLAIQLVANLHAQLALPANGGAQRVELVILVAQHAAVVGVDLLVVEVGLVGWSVGVVRGVVAVGCVEEGGAVGVCFLVGIGIVGEADGFGRLARLGLCGCEVWGEGGVVGLG
jgi:hypothetical protein